MSLREVGKDLDGLSASGLDEAAVDGLADLCCDASASLAQRLGLSDDAVARAGDVDDGTEFAAFE